MINTYFTSDLHLGHDNIIKYCRPQYKNITEMHYDIVQRWNSIVREKDNVWILGDVVFGKDSHKFLPLLDELNGTKKLILGNHDVYGIENYLPYFYDILGVKHYKNTVLTHIPVHEEQLERRFEYNIHGHLHDTVLNDPRYINVCMEPNGMMPVSWKEIQYYMENG